MYGKQNNFVYLIIKPGNIWRQLLIFEKIENIGTKIKFTSSFIFLIPIPKFINLYLFVVYEKGMIYSS